jgi:serine/threonine protein kinase
METSEGWPSPTPTPYWGQESIIDIRKHGNAIFSRGAFGELSVAIHRNNCPHSDRPKWGIAAVKTIQQMTIPRDNNNTLQFAPEIASELETLRILTIEKPHRNIVTWLGLYPDTNDPFAAGSALALAFQYCPTDLNGTLEWRKRNALPLLSFETIQMIAADLFAALVHCHSHSIMHGDVKPGNLLVTSAGIIQLCDFGLAKSLESSIKNQKATDSAPVRGLCTLQYRPPEILMGDTTARHPAVDIFSAGLVMAELLTGRALFPGCNELDQLSRIFQVLGTPSETHWPDAKHLPHGQQLQFVAIEPRPITEWLPRSLESPGLVDWLQPLLALDPAKRSTSAEAAHHIWLHHHQGINGETRRTCRRVTMQRELIPDPCMEPIILAVDENHLEVPIKQILDMTAKRRSIWKDLDVWKETG